MKPILDRIREEDVLPQKRAYDVVLPAAAIFVALMFTILLFGITMLYSTSFGTDGTTYLYKQFQWAIVGFAGFFGAIYIGFKRIFDRRVSARVARYRKNAAFDLGTARKS